MKLPIDSVTGSHDRLWADHDEPWRPQRYHLTERQQARLAARGGRRLMQTEASWGQPYVRLDPVFGCCVQTQAEERLLCY